MKKCRDTGWFADIRAGPQREEPLRLVLGQGRRRQDHDGNPLRRRINLQLGEHPVAGDVRQIEIEEDEVWPRVSGEFEPVRSVTGSQQLDPRPRDEDLLDQLNVRRVVLDAQDADGRWFCLALH